MLGMLLTYYAATHDQQETNRLLNECYGELYGPQYIDINQTLNWEVINDVGSQERKGE